MQCHQGAQQNHQPAGAQAAAPLRPWPQNRAYHLQEPFWTCVPHTSVLCPPLWALGSRLPPSTSCHLPFPTVNPLSQLLCCHPAPGLGVSQLPASRPPRCLHPNSWPSWAHPRPWRPPAPAPLCRPPHVASLSGTQAPLTHSLGVLCLCPPEIRPRPCLASSSLGFSPACPSQAA